MPHTRQHMYPRPESLTAHQPQIPNTCSHTNVDMSKMDIS
jgi:hypothetical protein